MLFATLHPLRGEPFAIEQGVAEYAAALEEGDRDARLQRFARAEQLFQQAANQQLQVEHAINTELLVNWGNAALQAEHLGPAILAYRRALWQQPAHPRARQNLAYARTLLPDSLRVDSSSPWMDELLFWRFWLSRTQLVLLAAFSFCVAAIALAASIVWSLAWPRWLTVAAACLWGLLSVSLLAGPSDRYDAVVIVDETYLRTADAANAPQRIAEPLVSGTELKVLERRERWLEVEIGGRSGWVAAGDVALVMPLS